MSVKAEGNDYVFVNPTSMCFCIGMCSTPDFITPVDQQFAIDLDNKVTHLSNFLWL